MYYIKWALKNIIGNRARYTVMVILTAFTFITLLLFDAVISGYDIQTDRFRQAIEGDIRVSSSDDGGLSPLLPALSDITASSPCTVFYPAALIDGVRLITDTGDMTVQLAGVTDGYAQTLLNSCTVLKEGAMNFSQPESCLVDADTAEKLSLKAGDEITLYFEAPSKHIISEPVTIGGIFISNYLAHSRIVYMPLIHAAGFMEKEDFVNTVLGTVAGVSAPEREQRVNDVVYAIRTAVKKAGILARVEAPDQLSGSFGYFQIFDIFKIILIGLKNLTGFVLALMLLFAVRSAYYLIFQKRRAEIATLRTYGMDTKEFIRMITAETVIVLLLAALIAAAVTIPAVFAVQGFPAAYYSANLIAVFGGPSVVLHFDGIRIAAMAAVIAAVNFSASMLSMCRALRTETARLSAES